MCYHCILFLAFLLSSHHLSNLFQFFHGTDPHVSCCWNGSCHDAITTSSAKIRVFTSSGGGMVTLQGWSCTSCWWATRPSGTRTSTASTPRSRRGRMTTPPRSGTLSLLRWLVLYSAIRCCLVQHIFARIVETKLIH